MEEDDNLRTGFEFPHELCEDSRYHIADFVEKNAYAVDFPDNSASKRGGECDFARRGSRQEVPGLDPVFSFGGPLLLLSVAPKSENE